MTEPPDRVTISIPPDEDLDAETIEDLVRQSDYGSRSEYIRAAIAEKADDDGESS